MDQKSPKPMMGAVLRLTPNVPPPSKCDEWLDQASDQSLPAATRIQAIHSLANECLEHRVFQNLGWIVGNEREDVAVRSAIVRVLPRWGDSAMPMMAILGALSLLGVRPTAIETLDDLGQVSGIRNPGYWPNWRP
jgi:ferritin